MPKLRRVVALCVECHKLIKCQPSPANPPLTSPNARRIYHLPTSVADPSTDVIPTRYRRNTDVIPTLGFSPFARKNSR